MTTYIANRRTDILQAVRRMPLRLGRVKATRVQATTYRALGSLRSRYLRTGQALEAVASTISASAERVLLAKLDRMK